MAHGLAVAGTDHARTVQDVANGKTLSAEHALASVTVHVLKGGG